MRREVDVGLIDDEHRAGMRGGDSDEAVGMEVGAGRVVRVRDDHGASGIHRRVDLLERRGLCASRIEAPIRESLE